MEQGTWWARSEAFLQQPIFQTLRWMRAPGDTLFAVGALAIAWFFVGSYLGFGRRTAAPIVEAPVDEPTAAE